MRLLKRRMTLPNKLNRKAIKQTFDKVSEQTWEYLFDHEKENGLSRCRTKGWGVKQAWYSSKAIVRWVKDRGYYQPDDFEPREPPVRQNSPWAPLYKRQALAA